MLLRWKSPSLSRTEVCRTALQFDKPNPLPIWLAWPCVPPWEMQPNWRCMTISISTWKTTKPSRQHARQSNVAIYRNPAAWTRPTQTKMSSICWIRWRSAVPHALEFDPIRLQRVFIWMFEYHLIGSVRTIRYNLLHHTSHPPFNWMIRHSWGENRDTMNKTMLTPTYANITHI